MTERGLYEREIKAKVLNELKRRCEISHSAIIASEYAIGNTGRRIDLAFLSSEFVGIEIKGERDSLFRLDGQVSVYEKIFDRTIVVVAEKHMIKTSLLIGGRCDIWSINEAGLISEISQSNRPKRENRRAITSLLSLEQLRECVAESERSGASRSRLRAKAEALPERELYAHVQSAFTNAFAHSTRAFWAAVGRNKIRGDHVGSLSRFAAVRRRLDAVKKENDRFWDDWRSAAALVFRSESDLRDEANQSIQSPQPARQEHQAGDVCECLSARKLRAASR